MRLHAALLSLLLVPTLGIAAEPATKGAESSVSFSDKRAARSAEEVKAQFLHAWRGYREYAWGHDALKPLTNAPSDWYGESLLMTPVDALDTMILMGLDREAAEARELIATKLSFDRDLDVKHFEVVIRLLGGLLSSYQLTGDQRLLALANDLGTRLLPAFDSPKGLPYVYVNLRTGKAHGNESNPAEAGTLLLEYGTLSKLTGNPVFYEKAKRALVETYKRRSKIGLVGERFDVTTGEWTNKRSHVGARIDSYYEYLWKCWTLFGDEDCHAMWKESIAAANRYYPEEVDGALWVGHVDMDSGERVASRYGALDAFWPGLLALSGDVAQARRLQDSSFKMWRKWGIEPEAYDYRKGEVTSAGYPLRPEIIESAWYLHRLTGDAKYRAMGREMFDDFVRYTRTDSGFAALDSVITKDKDDDMESFVLAETFKYFYLLFAPPETLDPSKVVLTTEAHPLRRTW
ncbi:glycoside hydrolase family 47 protein [Lysobacter soli]|uniref:glycoside hydrolase family 47 protein n=1 Tax=Lysobacter soli TaxID=453783 RepID=UPI00209CA860|nr:glycoside hydrolase family 47 protein [Lysobacter soli]UTA54517.1 glycoside hydrolase family 47 protein [Lysobacter soli]